MTILSLAKQLKTPPSALEKESIKAFLEKELRNINADLLRLAFKYGVKDIKELDKLIKRGKVKETEESRNDFFHFDELEFKKEKLESLVKNYAKFS